MEAGHSLLWRNATDNPQPWVLGLCVAIFALLIGTEIWATNSAFRHSIQTSPPASDSAAGDPQIVAKITDADLFGHATNQNSNLPQTDLQVILRAVFAARDSKNASAVIETGDGHSEIVKVGGSIGGNAVLHEVLDNRVVLSRNGTLETLYFPAPQESTAEFAVAQAAPPEPTGEAPTTSTIPASGSPDEIKRAVILQRLEELRARSSLR